MRAVKLSQYQALVGTKHVAAGPPFAALIEGGAEFGAYGMWLLGQVLTNSKLYLDSYLVSHVQASFDAVHLPDSLQPRG